MTRNNWLVLIWGSIFVMTLVLVYLVPARCSKIGIGLGTQVEDLIMGTTGHSSMPNLSSNDQTVRGLEQLTDTTSEAVLIGKRITVKASPEQVSGTSFWADTGHNAQVLVVMSRDRRDARERYLSEVAPTDLAGTPDQPVDVSGTIQYVPGPGERFSWGENDGGVHGPLSATVYLKVDREMPEQSVASR